MDFSKKLLVLLAIFCVIASAGLVCAEESDGGGYAGSQYQDEGGYAGSQYQDDGGWAGSQYNETLENATAAANQTAQNGTSQVTENTTASAPANTTTPFGMLATGIPIILVAVIVVIAAGVLISRRK